MTKLAEHAAMAAEAGFTAAAAQAEAVADRAGRLARAYEHYRFVKAEKIAEFNLRLYNETLRRTGQAGRNMNDHYDKLSFTPVEKYATLPPADVLAKVKEAAGARIFDTMEVAKIESVVEYKDPIVFGRIEGCTDRFFVAQWGSDVQITDLLGEHDG